MVTNSGRPVPCSGTGLIMRLMVIGVSEEPPPPSHQGRRAVRLSCFLGSPTEWGGMEIVVSRLLAGLPQRYEVTVMAVSPSVAERLVAERPGSNVLLLPSISGKQNLIGICRYISTLSRHRPDMLFANLGQLYAGQYALLAAAVARIPTVVAVHGVFPHKHRPLTDPLLRMLMRHMAAFVGVSSHVCRAIESEFRLPGSRVHLVYNGVPSIEERIPPPRGDGPMVIGAVGRLAWEKGLDVLVRAMASLPDCRLVLAGAGPCRDSLQALSRAVGVSERIDFVGVVESSWPENLGLDVVAVPSRSEGFSLTAVEAMRAGLPVVASDVGVLVEVLGRRGTVFVPPDDPDALARALRELADKPERRAEMGRAARLAVDGRYTVEEMLEKYIRLFDSVVA